MSTKIFEWRDGYIVGAGLSLIAPTGETVVTADMLNGIIALVRDHGSLGADDGTKLVEQRRRDAERIEAAKADLIERFDLGDVEELKGPRRG